MREVGEQDPPGQGGQGVGEGFLARQSLRDHVVGQTVEDRALTHLPVGLEHEVARA